MRRVVFLLFCFFFLPCRQKAAFAQPYKNLVLEGGGIRGIAYAGALQVLEERHQLDSVKNIAGTSVGGLVAALVAVGYSAEELKVLLGDLNIRKFNDGGWFFIGGQSRFRKRYGWYRGDRLEAWVGKLIEKKTGSAHTTLSELRRLAGSNTQYKQLFLTATDLSAQKTVLLHAGTYPDVEVRTAVRTTISIPLYYTAVLLDSVGRRHKSAKECPQCHVLVDGGVLENYPLAVFDSLYIDGQLVPNPKTLGLKLERVAQLPFNELSGEIAAYPIRGLGSYVGALYNLCIEGLNRKAPFAAEQYRTIYISTGDIRPRVRHISLQQKEILYQNGIKAARHFLKTSDEN